MALHNIDIDSQLEKLVTAMNQLVNQINTMGTNAINVPVVPIDLEIERAKLRTRRDAK